MKIIAVCLLFAGIGIGIAAPANSVVAAPPISVVYTMIYKAIDQSESDNATVQSAAPNSTPAPTAASDPLQPLPASGDVSREVEYIIAGNTASIKEINAGRPVRTLYYVGPFCITSPAAGEDTFPYITRLGSAGADTEQFRFTYPYTYLFKPEHSKGRVVVEGRPAVLYELPDTERKALIEKIDQAEEGDPSLLSAMSESTDARRLWVEEGTRRPLVVETESEVIRFQYKGSAPAQIDIPANCKAALKHYVEASRVERAKPY